MKKIFIIACLLVIGISNAQKTTKNTIILKKWNIENAKDFFVKTGFKITENGVAKTVFLEFKKETVELNDAVSKKTIEKYPNLLPKIIIPKVNCQQQSVSQWKYFYTFIYPKLLKNANLTCKSQRYCLLIYCNGIPTTAYMLLINPTVKCPVEKISYYIVD